MSGIYDDEPTSRFFWQEHEVLEEDWYGGPITRIAAGHYPNGEDGNNIMRVEIQIAARETFDEDIGMVTFRPTLAEVEAWCVRAHAIAEEKGIKT